MTSSPNTGKAGEVRLSLPFPPSVNALWRAVNGHNILSESYRLWKSMAGQELALTRCDRIAGPYNIALTFDRPDRRARDVFNYEKAVSDLLVARDVIEDDHLAQRGTVEWSDRTPGKGARVHVLIEALS